MRLHCHEDTQRMTGIIVGFGVCGPVSGCDHKHTWELSLIKGGALILTKIYIKKNHLFSTLFLASF